jgi:hypothetical protein
VISLDAGSPLEVGDGARELEAAMIGAGGHAQSLHGRGEDLQYVTPQQRDLVDHDILHYVMACAEVAMCEPVSHSHHRSPVHPAVLLSKLPRPLLDCLADDLQIANEDPVQGFITDEVTFGQSLGSAC